MSEPVETKVRGKAVSQTHTMPPTPDVLAMRWGERRINSWRAQESQNCRLESSDGEAFVTMGLARVAPDGKAAALYMAMTPAFAREFAAELLEHADAIDGGKGKQ